MNQKIIDGSKDITFNEALTYMTLEQRAKLLAGIECKGKETKDDTDRWARILNSMVVQ